MRAAPIMAATTLVLALAAAPAPAQQTQEWSFTGIERVELDGVSGDVRVRPAQGSELRLVLVEEVEPAGAFRAGVEQDGPTLRVDEDWTGRNSSGRVEWTLEVPSGLRPLVVVDTASGELDVAGVAAAFRFDSASGDVRFQDATVLADSTFDTASGDLLLTDTVVEDDVEMETASGDVELTGVTAGRDFDFSTASGDVTVERSEGVLRGSTASGNVRVIGTTLDGPGRFSSASGDVELRLDAFPVYELEASSASGDVRFEVPSFGNGFALIMSARQDRGRIDSPFEPTSQRTFERGSQTYVEHTVQRGSGQPEIRLHTASGTVQVREGR